MTCRSCGTKRYMEFTCVDCCLKWLKQMTAEEMALNAPVIEKVAGAEQMEKVRAAWKKRSFTTKKGKEK